MASVDPCYAAYQKCLGTNPTPEQQIQCTFAYAACVHQGLAEMVQAHITGPAAAGEKVEITAKKAGKKKSKPKAM